MTKSKLVGRVSSITKCPEWFTERILDFAIETIISTVQSGEPVVLAGFGTFYLATYEEHRGYNPSTGEHVVVPTRKALRFRVSEKLKDEIKGKSKKVVKK